MSTLSLQLVLTWIGVGACVGAAVGMVVSTVVILVVRVVVGAGVDVGPPMAFTLKGATAATWKQFMRRRH